MLKKIIVIIPLFFFCFLSADVEIRTGMKLYYSDNVFSLSDSDLDKFDAGEDKFSFIETSDDFVTDLYGGLRFSFPKNFLSTRPFVSYHKSFYLKNNDKDRYSFSAGFYQPIKRLGLTFKYSYLDGNYSRKYDDRDGTDEYERFEYDKDYFDLSASFKVGRKDFLLGKASYSIYKYNQYFTEYDGDLQAFGIGWKHSFPKFYLRFMYKYNDFVLDSKDWTEENAEELDYVRDGTYECNIYELQIRSKKIKINKNKFIRPVLNLDFEQKYYTTDLSVEVDPIHSAREDQIIDLNFGVELKFFKNLDIFLDYYHRLRKVTAEDEDLSEIKDYSRNKIQLEFLYRFTL